MNTVTSVCMDDHKVTFLKWNSPTWYSVPKVQFLVKYLISSNENNNNVLIHDSLLQFLFDFTINCN